MADDAAKPAISIGEGSDALKVQVLKQMAEGEVSYNIKQEIIVTTKDKVTLCLRDALASMEHRRAWESPVGLLIIFLTTLLTTEFQDVFFLSKYTWKAIYVVGAVLSAVWLVKALARLRKVRSIDSVVEAIRKGSLDVRQ